MRIQAGAVLAFLPLLGGSVLAQGPTLLPPGDSTLLEHFCDLHESISDDIDQSRQADPAGADALALGARKMFGINATDFGASTRVCRSVNAGLQDVSERLACPAITDAGKPPESATCSNAAYDEAREKILTSGKEALQKELSTEGWRRLQAYIYETLRSKVRTVPLGFRRKGEGQ